MHLLTYLIISFISLFSITIQNDLEKLILAGLRNGEVSEISKRFSSSLKISIDGEEQVVAKYQGELIFADYFSNNKLQDIKKSTLSSDSDNQHYVVYDARLNKKHIKILLKLAKIRNSEYITEFHVK